ncbi:hypothetical protein SAMN05421825_3752 [Epilithonimonas hungarica]|uniref:Uncharacterized protein n=2 Tax=Epilithonimonas hungarica TaxID=454006 RepID=A0A1G7VY81_9FLAO|nr:hypothetical protein SAMN05421825_3752 [Epilithonimonas hungarica]
MNTNTNKFFLLLFTLIYCVSCSQNKENHSIIQDNTTTMKNDNKDKNMKEIENQIKLQRSYTCGDISESDEYVFSKKDLDILLPLIEEMLQSNGYMKPDYAKFKEVIERKFHINIDETSDDIFIINRNDFVQYKGSLDENLYDLCLTNLFIDKKRKFVTPMLLLENIYDSKSQKIKQNLKISLFNKYLFNNDKSGVSYLVNNESEFMYDILVLFRFDDIVKSNKKSLNIFYSNMEMGDKYKIGDVIFNKNKKENLFICNNLLSTFSDLFNENKEIQKILPLKYYSSRLIDNQRKDIFKEKEKMKILAYLANIYDSLFKQYHHDGQNWGEMTILADYRDYLDKEEWEKVKQEYQKNNYYNLPNLKAMVDYADMFDSVGAPD